MGTEGEEESHNRRLAVRWGVISLTSMGIFLALAWAVSLGGVSHLERDLYGWIALELSPGSTPMFQWVNSLGDKRFLIPGILLLVLAPPRLLRRRWWLWLGVMLAVAALEGVMKEVVGRPRPEGSNMGFPSGHTAAAAAFFVMAAYLGEKSLGKWNRQAGMLTWTLAAVLILLVGIARVILRAHWPLDVAGGATLGLACAAAAAWWNERNPYR